MKAIAWMTCLAATVMGVAFAGPALAQAPDVILFELTEDMRLTPTHRIAASPLGGFAFPKVGSPLCPAGVPALLSERPDIAEGGVCIVNGIGSNVISLKTFTGPINGSYTVVVQDSNPVDIEEAVVLRGRFQGTMDLSTTGEFPFLGTMSGHVSGNGTVPFVGVVRLPFPCGAASETGFCYGSSGPNGIPDGGVIPVGVEAFALGRPTVRLDIYLQAPSGASSGSTLRRVPATP
jgi:hypothetical protein